MDNPAIKNDDALSAISHGMVCRNIQLGKASYVYYEIPNPGKPKMLLLHGMLVESHCFDQLASYLKDNYHLYFLDLKGHGKSANGSSYDSDYTPDVIANDLLAFHQIAIQEPFYLLGYSLGGQYAIKFAGTHPDLIKGLLIVDSAPALCLKATLTILLTLMLTPKYFASKEHASLFYEKRAPGFGEYIARYCLIQDAQGRYVLRYDKKNFAPDTMAKSAARTKDLWEACRKITAPTLILRCEKSFVFSNRLEKKMRESIAKSTVVLMKGMKHLVGFSHPRELAGEIQSYLQKVSHAQ